jgi:hypothetical protein
VNAPIILLYSVLANVIVFDLPWQTSQNLLTSKLFSDALYNNFNYLIGLLKNIRKLFLAYNYG